MKDNISPEEKLLRLIRGEKKAKPFYPPKPEGAINKTIPPNPANLGVLSKNSASSSLKSYFTPLAIQKIMILLMAASFIYLSISFIYPLVGFKKVTFSDTAIKTEGLKFAPREEAKPYEFYLEAIKQRQLFGSISAQESSSSQVAMDTDLVKQINLVGIIAGDNPQAVIEDKNTQKTYYLNIGQFIGEMQIEDIREGKIIINHKGQRFELYL